MPENEAKPVSCEESARASPKDAALTSNFERWLTQEAPKRSSLGVAYLNLHIYGHGLQADYQKNFANYPLAYLNSITAFFKSSESQRVHILRSFEGLVHSGEALLVLGRPGSGCTTLLKTLAGHTHGLHIGSESKINYQGATIFHDLLFS